MLVILWFAVLCVTVGAREQHEMTDEAEQVLDDLNSYLNDETYSPKSKRSPIWNPREFYNIYPEEHWSSTTNPERRWPSTTEYTMVDDLNSYLNDETYSPKSKRSPIWNPREFYNIYPEKHWPSTTEHTMVDHSEGQTDDYGHEYAVKEPLDSYLNDDTYSPKSKRSPIWNPREFYNIYPEKHWPSTTEHTIVDHSEGQTDDYGHEYAAQEPSDNDHEREYPVGSIRGIPGITFPDYMDIPLTDFRCSDKTYVPGFYADMETGCQVFHVCWPHRRESFLCPVGTIFNQAILACDYWYSSNCSLASHYYEVNADPDHKETTSLRSMIDSLLEVGKSDSMIVSSESNSDGVSKENVDLSEILKFLPVKAKVVVYPETAKGSKIIAEASMGKIKKSNVVKQVRQKPQIHEVEPEYINVRRPHEVAPVQRVTKEINRIIDRVFDIIKNILKETEGSLPVQDKGLQKGNQEHENRKYPPLTKLNPRFIIKPAELRKQRKRSIPSTTETPELQKPRVLSNPQIKVQPLPSKKPMVSDFVSGRRHTKPSSSNKKTLTESYLKLIKTRSS